MSTPRERLDEVGKKIKRETDHVAADSMARRQQLEPAGALNRITPCAACKLLRRRCAQECPFSPYFSPHEPQKFASVHKVFGASNVSKMLMEVPESQRADATNSLVYEANIRLRDPVYGCMGIISSLQQQVQALEAELTAVRGEILKCKYRQTGTAAGAAAAVLSAPPSSSSSAAAALLAASCGMMISVAALPPPPPPWPARAAASSSSSSMYAAASSSTDYSSITNENISFFG
ncbi:LOB domain-containing protein 15-like [Curcuma longa]|uniref:LOB domain-containing protein 15-like n=1 Tax=Curcuma longa TaxID=136217 RepID=UPI003D9FA7C8